MSERKLPSTLSVIIPIHNEAPCIDHFFQRIVPLLEAITPKWEILCVDDGSRDESWHMLLVHARKDPRIRLIRFSRNFGKEAALAAGMRHSCGQVVIPIDADLQDPPECITDMIAKWREGYDVVLTTQKRHPDENQIKTLTARLFYAVMDSISEVPIPRSVLDFRLMDRKVVEAFNLLPERNRFFRGLCAFSGFRTTLIELQREARVGGESSHTLRSLLRYALDGICAYSLFPLRIWIYLGAVCAGLGFLLGLGAFIGLTKTSGAVISAVFFLGGIQLISTGILGEYLGRTYRETQQRPLYIIAEQKGLDNTIK